MSIASLFGWSTTGTPTEELPLIFPLGFAKEQFIWIDVIHIYSKILTDVLERTHGLNDEQENIFWDNCIKSEASFGLITLLARAMTHKKDLFLIYDKSLKLLREATGQEAQQIRDDYVKSNKSKIGVYISFAQYRKSDLIMLYSALEYCTIASLNKSINLSIAIQLKMNDLRGSVSLADSADVKTQARKIAEALANGRDVMLDAKDMIENAVPDLTAIETSIKYLCEKKCFYLGLPESYLTGEQTSGLNATGDADTKAIERGLKNYFESIIKPVLTALFEGIKITYKSQDFAQIESAMDVLKTFEITGETLVSQDNKQLIINRLFDLPENAKGDPAPAPEPVVINEGQKFASPPTKPPGK